jgi:hypothetical protein
MLAFFDSWRTPAPLSRAWCVWELYGAARFRKDGRKVPLQIVFEPAERERFFEDGLIGDFDSIGLAFTNMRVKDARCRDAGDEAMINRSQCRERRHVALRRLLPRIGRELAKHRLDMCDLSADRFAKRRAPCRDFHS